MRVSIDPDIFMVQKGTGHFFEILSAGSMQLCMALIMSKFISLCSHQHFYLQQYADADGKPALEVEITGTFGVSRIEAALFLFWFTTKQS